MHTKQVAVRFSDSDLDSLEKIRKFYGVHTLAEAIRIAITQTSKQAEEIPAR